METMNALDGFDLMETKKKDGLFILFKFKQQTKLNY
jgi:hypothetical protein